MSPIQSEIFHYKADVYVSKKGDVFRLVPQKTICSGYPMISVSHKTTPVHRIVAETFIPNPNGLPEINHKDENKFNNSVENLEWCTKKYNQNYGTSKERKRNKLGKKVLQLKIGTKEVVASFDSITEAYKKTLIGRKEISRCCRGINKSAGGFAWEFGCRREVNGES